MSVDQTDTARLQMEAEKASLRAHLESAHSQTEGFAAQMLRRQASERIAALERDISQLDEDVFELAFAEKSDLARHSLPTTVLTNLLSRFQKAITYAGWARLSGPGIHGTPPAIIARAFETEVGAFGQGSFLVALSPHDTTLEHDALHQAFVDFLSLAGAATEIDAPTVREPVEHLAQRLGGEATKRFALFFSKLHEAQLEARFEWRSRPEKAISLQPVQAKAVAAWLRAVEQKFDTVTVRGTLTAADSNDARFAITDELGEIHLGKAAPELLSHAMIDAPYVARMRVTTFKSSVTGSAHKRAVLEALDAIED